MKPMQLVSIVLSLVLAIGLVAWLANSAPSFVVEQPDELKDLEGNESESLPKVDYERTNPFDLSGDGPHPKALAEELIYDFGNMALGQTGEHDFVIQNTGDLPLKIARGPSQCKCTVSGLKTDEIAPGETASVHLEWTPTALGPFGQGASIWTNDPENKELIFRVEGEMHREIVSEPEGGWVLGTVSKESPTTFEGVIYSGVIEDFAIEDVTTSSDNVQVEVTPMAADDLEDVLAKVGFQLKGTFKPDGRSGPFREKVTVTTNLEEHQKFEFNLTGNQSGPIVIVGPSWYKGPQLFDLGKIVQGEASTSRLTLMIEKTDQPVEVGEIQVEPKFLKVEMVPEETSETSSRERFTLRVEVPADSPVGRWNGDRKGSLKIKTSHPQLQEISMSLDLEIRSQ
ncbi:DUF1573 domain-containing protein [Thalassoglobus sp. JC818]|uniref:DUF1573 domain-containing protein n=1 Tax=Thalassoglobus sp. JC818 TaxID=3232136 RepID=UPI0034590E46